MKNLGDYIIEQHVGRLKRVDISKHINDITGIPKYLDNVLKNIKEKKLIIINPDTRDEHEITLSKRPSDDEITRMSSAIVTLVKNSDNKAAIQRFNDWIREYIDPNGNPEHAIFANRSPWNLLSKQTGGPNKGERYEKIFIDHYQDFEVTTNNGTKKVEKGYGRWLKKTGLLPMNVNIADTQALHEGTKNQKRNITSLSSIDITGERTSANAVEINYSNIDLSDIKPLDIGSTITDVTIIGKGLKKPLYLSLKYGPAVTLVNLGISKILNKESLENAVELNDLEKLPKQGQNFFRMFGLDPMRTLNIFKNYSKDTVKHALKNKKYTNTQVDVLKNVKKNYRELLMFLKEIIGHGYVIIHGHDGDGGLPYYYDLRKAQNIEPLLSGLSSAHILYGGKTGFAKNVEIDLKFKYLELAMKLRSKNGGIFPNSLTINYNIDYEALSKDGVKSAGRISKPKGITL